MPSGTPGYPQRRGLCRPTSVHYAAGYFEPNERGAYSLNDLTATRDHDGSITVWFGGGAEGTPNCLPIVPGWNHWVRLYRPRPEILDGTWSFPEATPVRRQGAG